MRTSGLTSLGIFAGFAGLMALTTGHPYPECEVCDVVTRDDLVALANADKVRNVGHHIVIVDCD